MNITVALIIGIVLLVVAYMVPQLTAGPRTLLMVIGWVLVLVALVLILLSVLGVSTGITI